MQRVAWQDMHCGRDIRRLVYLAAVFSLLPLIFSVLYLHDSVQTLRAQPLLVESKRRSSGHTNDSTHVKAAEWQGVSWKDLVQGGQGRQSCGPEDRPRILCVRAAGRLGNTLFAYASSLGVSLRANLTLRLWPEYAKLLPHFALRGELDDNNLTVCRGAQVRPEHTCCVFRPELMHVGRTCGRVQQLAWYLQSWRYFQHAEQEVRKDFRFRGATLAFAQRTISYLREFYSLHANGHEANDDDELADARNGTRKKERPRVDVNAGRDVTLVGVHVRHGDIVYKRVASVGYVVPPVEYYVRAMRYFLQRYGNVVYVITTDNFKYVSQHVLPTCTKIGARCHLTRNAFQLDFAVLAHCDHVIMSVGSFGWWAGWLAGGEVVYYKYPAREGSVLRMYMSYADYYPPTWTAME